MEIKAAAKTEYDIQMKMSKEELNGLINELEEMFKYSVATQKTEHIQHLTEFKNLLILSANNS